MKSRILMATAAVGLVISGVAIASENAPSAATKSQAANTNTTAPAAAAMASNAPAAPTANASQQQAGKTVLDLAAGNSEFSTLAKAVKAAGLEQTLSGKGPITVFAPTNAAFAKLGTEKLNNLLKPENKAELTQILTYHVVPQNLPAQSSAQPTSLTTAEGQSIKLNQQGTTLQVQNAKSQGQPISASNGSIIAIDSVLLPEAQAKMGTAPAASSANAPASATPASSPAPAAAGTSPSAMAPAAPAATAK